MRLEVLVAGHHMSLWPSAVALVILGRGERLDVELIPDDAMIRVYDAAGNVIETHEHKRDFKEW